MNHWDAWEGKEFDFMKKYVCYIWFLKKWLASSIKMIVVVVICKYNINIKLIYHQPATKKVRTPKYAPLKKPKHDTRNIFQYMIW